MSPKSNHRVVYTLIVLAILYLTGIANGCWTPTFGLSSVDKQYQVEGVGPYAQ